MYDSVPVRILRFGSMYWLTKFEGFGRGLAQLLSKRRFVIHQPRFGAGLALTPMPAGNRASSTQTAWRGVSQISLCYPLINCAPGIAAA
jgi:hypothetical protein